MLKVILIALVLAFVGLSAKLFVFPDQDSPGRGRADAVIVLAGGRKPRLAKGLELMRRSVAPTLVISDAPVYGWPEADRLCRGHARFQVLCFKAKSYSTRGEAEEIGGLVRRHHWKTIVIVTSTYHVTRARMLVERCVSNADVLAVGAHYPLSALPRDVASEWAKYLYAKTLGRSC